MIEMLIVGLKKAKMGDPKLLDAPAGVTIRPEQNAVLILQKKLPDQTRRTAQILHRRRDLDVGIRILVEKRSDPVHIVIEHRNMSVDEVRLRVLPVYVFTRSFDHIWRHKPILVIVPFRVVPPETGFIALVFGTDRQETAVGIA